MCGAHSVQTGLLCDAGVLCRGSWDSAIRCLEKAGRWETQPVWLPGRASLIGPRPQQRSGPGLARPRPGALPAARLPPRPREQFKRLYLVSHHVAQKDVSIGL